MRFILTTIYKIPKLKRLHNSVSMKSFSAVEDFHIRTSLKPMSKRYGTIFVAGSLQGPLPAAPTAATRTQQRVPLIKFGMMQVDFVVVIASFQSPSFTGSTMFICHT